MPKKIRQLISLLRRAGFRKETQEGSHRKFEKETEDGKTIRVGVSGKEGDDAHHYQEAAVKEAIRRARGE